VWISDVLDNISLKKEGEEYFPFSYSGEGGGKGKGKKGKLGLQAF